MRTKFIFIFLLLQAIIGSSFAQQKITRPQFLEGEFFVKLKNELHLTLPDVNNGYEAIQLHAVPGLKALVEKYGIYEVHKTFVTRGEDLDNIYTFRFSFLAGTDDLLSSLKRLAIVDYAEKCPIHYPDYTPNDYNALTQWHIAKIDALSAWNISKGSPKVTIAIVDDAFALNHPDLAANVWVNPNEIAGNNIDDDQNGFVDDVKGWDVADNDSDASANLSLINCQAATFNFCHGTGVASCASAVTDNGIGTTAIGFNCKFIPIKATKNSATQGGIGFGYQGIDYAIKAKADVINMSWGSGQYTATGQAIVTAAHNAGIVMCGSAGNDTANSIRYPSGFKYVIAVAATNQNDNISSFSNYHDSVDVCAPGVAIRTCSVTGGYNYTDGTSESSPITAGLCALMLSVNPCLTPDEVTYYLKASCDFIPVMNVAPYIGQLGAGRINARKALQMVLPSLPPSASFTSVIDSCGGTVAYNFQTSTPLSCPDSYMWDFPGGTPSSSSIANPTVTYTTGGSYTATLTTLNSMGVNVGTQTFTLNVQPMPTVNAGADITGCYNTQAQLNAICADPNANISWYPTVGLASPNSTTTNLTFLTSYNYVITATNPISGCVDKDTIKVQVNPLPSTYAGADVVIAPGASAQLNALGAATYSWDPPIGLSAININNPVANPTNTRLYTVFGTNALGCTKFDAVLVTVTGTTDIQNDLSNVADIQAIAPNPTKGQFNLNATFATSGNLTIQLFDLTGKSLQNIYDGKISEGAFSQSCTLSSHISAGVYLCVWEMNGRKAIQKVVVE